MITKPKKPKMYKGKSTRKGMGGDFQRIKDAIMKTGKTEKEASAITAAQGIKKYGKTEFMRMAKQGKKRASLRKKVK